jgi:hypothetical protein
MPDFFSKKITTRLTVLGIYQVIGGIAGLGLLVWLILKLNTIPDVFLPLLISAFALYFYSIYCGYLLLKKKKSGLKHSLINQCLQLISFAIAGYAFQYFSGIYLTIGIDITQSFLVNFGFGVSSWQTDINTDSRLLQVNFNLVAFCLVIFITRIKTEMAQSGTKS